MHLLLRHNVIEHHKSTKPKKNSAAQWAVKLNEDMLTLTKVINTCKSARTSSEKGIANYVLKKTVRDGGVDFLKCDAVSIIC